MARRLIVLIATTLVGCATGAPIGGRSRLEAASYRPFAPAALVREIPRPPPEAPVTAPPDSRERALALARGLVGKSRVEVGGRRYPGDCTGLIKAVFDDLGMDVSREAKPGENGVTALFRFAAAHGRVYEGGWPVPGDLVFFRETYDVNRDGRVNDGLTHVGLVDEVHPDGTIGVIHRVKRGVVRYRMNLRRRELHRDPASGELLNDYLRAAGAGARAVLTGELFAAYATVFPVGAPLASRDVEPR